MGVLGGSFDPPHVGHLRIAKLAQRALSLDEVLFIPCAKQPLKAEGPIADVGHRAAMVALALQRNSLWRLDTREISRGGTSYTVDTLQALRAERPKDALFLLIGQDSLKGLSKWRRAKEIPSLATLAVVPRGDGDPTIPTGAEWVRASALAVSSTDIRRRIASRQPWEYLVPAPVARYIERQGLYGLRRCS